MKIKIKCSILSGLYLSAALGATFTLVFPANAETLKGGVKEKTAGTGGDARPNRAGSDQGVDPFNSGGSKQETDSGQGAGQSSEKPDASSNIPDPFRMDSDGNANGTIINRRAPASRAGRPPASVNNRGGNNSANGARPAAAGGRSAVSAPPRNAASENLRAATPTAEPENSPGMKLAWDAWHQAVANGIYMRFNRLARTRFKGTTPLLCRVSYVITRGRNVGSIRVVQPSANAAFDQLIVSVVKSMAGSPSLEFPRHSLRQSVERSGTFTLNETASGGYKYQKGDTELIRN